MEMKRVFYLLIMLWAGLAAHAEDYYAHEVDQEAVKIAFDIIKLYYPDEKVCVSNVITDEEETLQMFRYKENDKDYKIEDDYINETGNGTPSEALASLFASESCDCEHKYTAYFTRPYKNMIACVVRHVNAGSFAVGFERNFLFVFEEYENELIEMIVKKYLY